MGAEFVTKCFSSHVNGNFSVLQGRIGQQLDDGSFKFSNAGSNMFCDKSDDILWNCHLEMIDQGFLAQNCDAMLKIR